MSSDCTRSPPQLIQEHISHTAGRSTQEEVSDFAFGHPAGALDVRPSSVLVMWIWCEKQMKRTYQPSKMSQPV